MLKRWRPMDMDTSMQAFAMTTVVSSADLNVLADYGIEISDG